MDVMANACNTEISRLRQGDRKFQAKLSSLSHLPPYIHTLFI